MTRSPFGINGRILSVWRICLVKSDFNAARAKPVYLFPGAAIMALMHERISAVVARAVFEYVRDTCPMYASRVRSLCFSIVYFRFCSFATKTFRLLCFHSVHFIIHAASVHIRMGVGGCGCDICVLKNLFMFFGYYIFRLFMFVVFVCINKQN